MKIPRIFGFMIFTLMSSLSVTTGSPAHAGDGKIEVTDAWIPTAPPSVSVHAAYLTLNNKTHKDRQLVAVESPAYKKAELHISRVIDDVASMEHVAQLEIPAGKQVVFKPGGLHLMLMKPSSKQTEGASVPLILKFQNGEQLAFNATVKIAKAKSGGMDHGAHGKMNHGSHSMDHKKGM